MHRISEFVVGLLFGLGLLLSGMTDPAKVVGFLRPRAGSIRLGDADVTDSPSHARAPRSNRRAISTFARRSRSSTR